MENKTQNRIMLFEEFTAKVETSIILENAGIQYEKFMLIEGEVRKTAHKYGKKFAKFATIVGGGLLILGLIANPVGLMGAVGASSLLGAVVKITMLGLINAAKWYLLGATLAGTAKLLSKLWDGREKAKADNDNEAFRKYNAKIIAAQEKMKAEKKKAKIKWASLDKDEQDALMVKAKKMAKKAEAQQKK